MVVVVESLAWNKSEELAWSSMDCCFICAHLLPSSYLSAWRNLLLSSEWMNQVFSTLNQIDDLRDISSSLEILRMVSKSLLEENLRLKGEADSVGKHFTLENATAQSVLV
jgi:hypothetical protein